LLTLAKYAIADVHEHGDEALDERVLAMLFNLRSQAESQSKDDAQYRPRGEAVVTPGPSLTTLTVSAYVDKNWITWQDAHRTRLACKLALDAATDKQSRLALAEQYCCLAMLTYMPPDRGGSLLYYALHSLWTALMEALCS
jgi:hypothetical protein